MTDSLIAGGWAALGGAIALLAPALVLTLLIEVPVGMLRGLRGRRAIGAVVLVNFITNPVVNYVLIALFFSGSEFIAFPAVYWVVVAILELLVVLAEWRLLLWVLGGSSRSMLLTSALMNAASFGAGLAVFWLLASGPIGF